MDDLCKLCFKQTAQYTCPRCHVRYCSVTCYRCKNHEQCSETFYRECFIEGLQDFNSTDEDRHKVMEMLQRLDNDTPELDSDDDDEPDLADRMEGLDLDKDTDKVWQRLTDREKAEFTKMAEDGRLSAMIKLWEPWWKYVDPSKVEEVGTAEAVAPPGTKQPALLHTPMLTKTQLSPTLPYCVLNILYGYIYVTRLHNGSHADTPVQTMKELENISESLGARSFDDVPTSLHACFHSLQHKAKSSYVSQDFQVATLSDLKEVLEGPNSRSSLQYIMAALSDVHNIAKAAGRVISRDLKKAKCDSAREKQLTETKKRWFAARKKMEFLLSWCHKHGLILQELIPFVDLEFCTLSTEMSHHQNGQKTLEEAWGGKRPPKMHRFIEEITDR